MAFDSNFGNKIQKSVNDALNDFKATVADQSKSFSTTFNKDAEGDNQETIGTIFAQFNKSMAKNSIMLRGLGLDKIDAKFWSSAYPYRFHLLQVEGTKDAILYKSITTVTLPITPQDLTITTPFASQVTAGSRGILEEHNGVVFKHINFTASTGMLAKRKVSDISNKIDSNVQAVFGGTVAAAQNFASAIANVFPKEQGAIPQQEDLVYTGYYQYHLIRAFLELYAHLKTKPGGQGYRLGFEVGKDRAIYLITPQGFTTKKSAASPMEYTYQFSCVAWGTADNPKLLGKAMNINNSASNQIGDVQKILNGVRNSRRVFETAKDIISAVKTDYETNILGPMNNIILTIKEGLSVAKTISDFPNQLALSMQSALYSLDPAFTDTVLPSEAAAALKKAKEASDSESDPSINLGRPITTALPVELNNPSVMDSIPVDQLPLSPEQQDAIADAVNNAFLNTNNHTLNSLIENLDALSVALEAQALNQGFDSPIWDILYSVNDTIENTYSLLADNFYGTNTISQQAAGANPLLDFYQGYAATGNVNFTKSASKFAIPFPFRTTLEWLAQKYLGDATRWIEIVAINNLQAPYIDEDGFINSFIANGSDRQFNVESDNNLYVNQAVWIFSDTKSIQKRTIKSIQKITDSNFLITVDGNNNLSEYTTATNAKMKAYLPYTVNSQKLIYIPIDTPSTVENITIKPITFIDETPEMLAMAKIDLLLDQDGDLAVSQDGFQNLSYGKQNIIQAARLKLQTVAGSLLLHPDFGAGQEVGESEAEISTDSILNSIRVSFESDPRFESVDNIEIKREPGVLSIRIQVTAADNQGIVPVEFKIE